MNTPEFALSQFKSTSFVLVLKPKLVSLFWLFGFCLFGLLFAMYDW